MTTRGDTLPIDDALNAVEQAIDLLVIAKQDTRPTEGDGARARTAVRAAYTLLKLAQPALEKHRP